MIDLTPLEVRKKKGDFRRIMRGYDPALVDDFLDLVADRLEALVRENIALSERTGRQDQQVAEYRERERALTEALVTAQEMREEIRKQTAREADLVKRTAEQEVTQLRAKVKQETTEVRAAAQQEAQKLRAAAQRDAAQIRSQLMLEREREEEAFRRLRGRQEQFLTSYRAFLERELSELTNLARVLGVASPDEEPNPRGRGTPTVFTAATGGPGPPAAAFMSARIDTELGAPAANRTAPVPGTPPPVPNTPPPALSTTPAEPAPEPLSDLDEFFAPGDDPELLDLAYAEQVEGADDLGLTDFDAEPFEPEPLLPEDMPPPKPTLRKDPNAPPGGPAASAATGTAPVGWADAPGWDAAASGGPGAPAPAAGPDADFFEGEDTSLLLRNAEAAGYQVPDLDQEADELLLDEELPAPPAEQDEGWLPSLLEDEEK